MAACFNSYTERKINCVWQNVQLLVSLLAVCIVTVKGLFGLFTWAKISAHVQTGPGAHLTSYTLDTGAFPGVYRPGRDGVIEIFH